MFKSESGHLGDSLEMDSKNVQLKKSMKLFDLKFCLISVTDHDIDHFMQDLLYSFVLFWLLFFSKSDFFRKADVKRV